MPPLAQSDPAAAVREADLLPEAPASVWQPLPGYAELLAARHEAHRATFAAMIGDLPLAPDSRVLDVAIGDGFYTQLLTERTPECPTTGLDVSRDFLAFADEAYVDTTAADLVAGDAESLPFADGTFDLVWCAHSLRSLPDAETAVREWARVSRGHVAVLENDRIHGVMLPWPPEIELAWYHAECAASDDECGRRLGGLHSGRRLHRLALACDLELVSKRTYLTESAPPSDEARAFLKLHLGDLAERCGDRLDASIRDEAMAYVDPAGEHYLPAADDLEMTFFDSVGLMRKKPPGKSQKSPKKA